MKPKLELVDEKNYKIPETTKHDLNFEHIGAFKLRVEVDSVGDILLMYFRQKSEESAPANAIEAMAMLHGARLPDKPFISRWACRSRFECYFDLDIIPMKLRAKKQLSWMKARLTDIDKRVAKNRIVAKELMEG